MIKSMIVLLIILLSTVQIAHSQGAKDYYIPLHVGNYLLQHTNNLPEGYRPSTMIYDVEDIDSIGDKEYFRVKQGYVHDDGSKESYWYSWVREDAVGLVNGAFGSSPDINEASIFEPPQLMLPNEMVNLGYEWGGVSPVDGNLYSYSVDSISETVMVPAGTFNDCIKIT
jgi:hypothetical protein